MTNPFNRNELLDLVSDFRDQGKKYPALYVDIWEGSHDLQLSESPDLVRGMAMVRFGREFKDSVTVVHSGSWTLSKTRKQYSWWYGVGGQQLFDAYANLDALAAAALRMCRCPERTGPCALYWVDIMVKMACEGRAPGIIARREPMYTFSVGTPRTPQEKLCAKICRAALNSDWEGHARLEAKLVDNPLPESTTHFSIQFKPDVYTASMYACRALTGEIHVDCICLTDAEKIAFRSFHYAQSQNPHLKTKTEHYEWLKDNGYEEYELPLMNTWYKQIKSAERKIASAGESLPAAPGKSVVSNSDI